MFQVFKPSDEKVKFLGFTVTPLFYRLIDNRTCKLYFYITKVNNGQGGWSYYDMYMLYKENDIFIGRTGLFSDMTINIGSQQKSLDEFFADCPDLVSKIKKKEFKKGDDKYIRLADYYNTSCQVSSNPTDEKEEE